jgi:hypothetical protein
MWTWVTSGHALNCATPPTAAVGQPLTVVGHLRLLGVNRQRCGPTPPYLADQRPAAVTTPVGWLTAGAMAAVGQLAAVVWSW